jgi:hypothetical protein
MCSFIINRIYLQPEITKICYATIKHVNQQGLIVHGKYKLGEQLAFSSHVSKGMKTFVLERLHLRLFVSQIKAKHRCHVKKITEASGVLSKNLFLCEQNIRNVVGKLAKETYKPHDNDANNIKMWVKDNVDNVFYFQKTSHEPIRGLSAQNIPFTIGIQTPWKKEMMLLYNTNMNRINSWNIC